MESDFYVSSFNFFKRIFSEISHNSSSNNYTSLLDSFYDIIPLFKGENSETKIYDIILEIVCSKLSLPNTAIIRFNNSTSDYKFIHKTVCSTELSYMELMLEIIMKTDPNRYSISYLDTSIFISNVLLCNVDKDYSHTTSVDKGLLLVPLLDINSMLHSILVVYTEKPDIATAHKLQNLTNIASFALDSNTVRQKMQNQITRSQLLYEIATLLNSDTSYSDALSKLVNKLQQTFNYLWVGIWTEDSVNPNNLVIAAQSGGEAKYFEGITIIKGKEGGIVGLAANTQQLITVNKKINKLQNSIELINSSQAAIALPIVKKGKLYGILDIRSKEIFIFNQRVRRFLKIISSQIAQTASSREEKIQKERELLIRRSIIKVSRAVTSILDIDKLLKRSLEILISTFDFWGAAIFIFDEKENVLKLATQAGIIEGPNKKLHIKIGREGVVGIAASTMKTTNIPNVDQFPFYIADIKDVRSEMAVPIMKNNKLLGIIDIYSNEYNAFDDQDEEIMELFSNTLAVSITNAKYYKQVQDLAIRDGLTGLYNHRHFMESMKRELQVAQRFKKPISLLMMDIDFFKKFNDTYGHQVGDTVLQKCAEVLRKNIRLNIDIAARYGGEEFAVILIETSKEKAFEIAERIRLLFPKIEIPNIESRITVSIGLSTSFLDNTNVSDLINSADRALYAAKDSGRNSTFVV